MGQLIRSQVWQLRLGCQGFRDLVTGGVLHDVGLQRALLYECLPLTNGIVYVTSITAWPGSK